MCPKPHPTVCNRALLRVGARWDPPSLFAHRFRVAIALLLLCTSSPLASVLAQSPTMNLLEGGAHRGAIALTHAGVGTPPELADGAQAAADAAYAELQRGQSSLEAAIAGTVVMENDPRYNAGTGANIRLDGRTIQMDASLMTSDGRFAAVAVIERVRNPVRVARAVLETPHLLLAGEGATRFAHNAGFEDVVPTCPEAEAKFQQRLRTVVEALGHPTDQTFDWRAYWNFPNPMPEELRVLQEGGDTVGSVTRDAEGRFAATLSTGGTSVTLYGRVGDVPVYAAGVFAGPYGAVACTGHGEEIIKRAMARTVYENMSAGMTARAAIEEAVRLFPRESSLGLIALDRDGWGVGANRKMAYGVAGP